MKSDPKDLAMVADGRFTYVQERCAAGLHHITWLLELTAPPQKQLCLATVTDDEYLSGTLVLLSSFLANNAWFHGDIVIIHAGLSAPARERLSAFPSVHFRIVSDALRRRLATLCEHVPQLAPRAARFHSLDAFDLPYETILFLDSDVLCTGDASDALTYDGPLLAAPDLSHWQGQVRSVETFVAVDERLVPPKSDAFAASFNAGVLLIRPGFADPSEHTGLLALLDPAAWASVRTGHTDQVVLNRYFRDRWRRLPDTFNVLLTPRPIALARQQSSIEGAVFLHFLARPKPWQISPADSGIDAQVLDAEHTPRKLANARWHEAWNAFLASDFSTPSSRSSSPA